jgi:hypothetical protein
MSDIHPVPFEEDEWPRYNADEEIILDTIPEGYYSVGVHSLRVVHSGHPPLKDQGVKTVGWIPNGGTKSTEAQYFAFLYPDGSFYLWDALKAENTEFPWDLPEALQDLATSPDPLEYGEEFAKRTGVCWNCGKALSRDQSNTRGLGPICWARLGGRDREA